MRRIFVNHSGTVRIPWRIIAFFALIFAAIFALNEGWRAAGLPGQRAATEWQSFAFAALLVAAVLLIIRYLLLWIEKRGMDAIWLPFSRSALKPLLLGTLLGCAPIVLLVVVAAVLGRAEFASTDFAMSSFATTLLPAVAAILLFAANEEFVLRGYLFRQLALVRGAMFAAILTGLLFGFLHSGNPGANWQGLVYTALGGFLMGLLLIRSGSLWLLVGYHFGWNACSGNLFGLTVSGMDFENSIWVVTLLGDEWFTGGSYGFESSLVTVFCELAVLSAAIAFLHKKRPEPQLQL